tara:strand:+ start:6319 stop:7098 length:780 start_codon:yes stop_codon:yes gene_type:complete
MHIIKELSVFNNIKFYEKEHTYYIGEEKLTSATSLIGKFKQPFDVEYWADRKAKERGITVEEIKAEWDFKKDFACEKGSALHAFVESYLFNKIFDFPEERVKSILKKDEFVEDCRMKVEKLKELFDKFYKDSYGKLIPVRAELVVGDSELGIGGMVDQLFFNEKSGKLEIWDWKTNKEIKKKNKWQRFKEPLSHLDICELNTYSLQLSLYKYIITKNTNLELGDCYIVWLNEKNDDYHIFKCYNFEKEIKEIIEFTKNN